jgi:uncharacterized protein (TIGR03435 family)
MRTMKAVSSATLIVVMAIAWTIAARQSPDLTRPAAASIKPGLKTPVPAAPRGGPDQFYRADVTLRSLVAYAYDVPAFRVVGSPEWPEWIRSTGWEVAAKAEGPVEPAQMRRLVQRLLADRFALKTRVETRDLPIFELALARDDGRLGPNLKPAKVDCEPFISGRQPMSEAPLDPVTKRPVCVPRFGMGSGGFTIKMDGQPIARFAALLQPELQRVVTDRTGLEGPFDLEFIYGSQFMAGPTAGVFETPSSDATALATALSEQLGLRLRSARGPVDVIVIEHAEQPTPN